MKCVKALSGFGNTRTLSRALIIACFIVGLEITSITSAVAGCGGGTVTEPPLKSKQINIVMDDSGSMFGGPDKTAWSRAKYSLEVFAALMNRDDSVNVYLMSRFKDGTTPSTPTLEIRGTTSPQDRVQQVRQLILAGGGTPFAPVMKAETDLKSASSDEKWLVILTDGKFDNIAPTQVLNELKTFVTETPNAKIAALALGDQAEQIPADKSKGIYSFKAKSSEELLNRMNDMANLIFERTAQQLSLTGSEFIWPTDIATRDIYLFAQGENVEVSSVESPAGRVNPNSSVKVQWSANPAVEYNNDKNWVAVPEKSLNGVLATFKKLPKGDIKFKIPNAKVVQVIFKPNVEFNAIIRDQSNKEVRGNFRAGKYTINYGFLDENCEIKKSDLLGTVAYSAKVIQNGQVIASDIPSGGKIDIGAGEITVDVQAKYLKNLTSTARINFGVRAAESTLILSNSPKNYQVSQLDQIPSPSNAIKAIVTIIEGGFGQETKRSFTAEEWATFNPEVNQIDTSSGLELRVKKEEQIGQLTILPVALNKDIYGVKTGKLQVPVRLPALNSANKPGVSSVNLEIKNDLSSLVRLWNWFKKWLPLLLLVVLILGYILKPRFATRGRVGIKRKPTIEGTPTQIGQQAFTGKGKFELNRIRRLIPFIADTATISYVPVGVFNFPKLKVKAARQKRIMILNWKQIATRNNTEVNGIPLDPTTTRPPTLRASSSIRASDAAMNYDMILNK